MLDFVIRWSLANRLIVIAAWLFLAALGVVSFQNLSLDAFPDIMPIQCQINTVAPALAPLEIERQLTFPVEHAISGLPHLKEVRSISKFGLSQVTVIFEVGTDL